MGAETRLASMHPRLPTGAKEPAPALLTLSNLFIIHKRLSQIPGHSITISKRMRVCSRLLSTAAMTTTQGGHRNRITSTIMTASDLSAAATDHNKRMKSLLQNNLYKDKKHPIYNFLFTYVFINPKILHQYSPGLNCTIEGVSYDGK